MSQEHKKPKPQKRPNYFDPVVGLKFPPGVHLVEVFHDDWCDQVKGVGPCNCDPDIEVIPFGQPEHN